MFSPTEMWLLKHICGIIKCKNKLVFQTLFLCLHHTNGVFNTLDLNPYFKPFSTILLFSLSHTNREIGLPPMKKLTIDLFVRAHKTHAKHNVTNVTIWHHLILEIWKELLVVFYFGCHVTSFDSGDLERTFGNFFSAVIYDLALMKLCLFIALVFPFLSCIVNTINLWMYIINKRMHSSRMRTVCSSGCLGGGGLPQGGCLTRGVSARGEGCLPRGVSAQTPPPREQNHR